MRACERACVCAGVTDSASRVHYMADTANWGALADTANVGCCVADITRRGVVWLIYLSGLLCS